MSSTPPPLTPTPTPPAQPSGNDAMHAVMQKLFDDSRATKSAHFIAAQRKARHATTIGVIVIVLNVLIGSGLIEAFVPEQQGTERAVFSPANVIKLLAFLAAALAGIQTFFNFQNAVECHTNAGNVYSSINHRLGIVIAEYSTNPADRVAITDKFKALDAEHLKANEDFKGCVPSDKDFMEARRRIEGRVA